MLLPFREWDIDLRTAMLKSLRFKILAAMVLVIIAGVVITALNATRTTRGEFDRYLSHGQMMRQMRSVALLNNLYAAQKSWDNVQPLVEQISQMNGGRIVVADSSLRIVGDSDGKLAGTAAGNNWDFELVDPDGSTAGYLYINPLLDMETGTSDYLLRVSRSVWVGALIAIVIAIFATLLISRSILHPVEELTAAVRQMQRGDMTARVNIQSRDEIGLLGNSFNAMAESINKQEQLRKNMVSDVAHELRTPLSNILGYLEAADDGKIATDQDLVKNLQEEAALINHLVDDLQELALGDAGHLRIEVSTISINELILSTYESFTPACQKLGITLTCDIPADLPAVKADAQRITQILGNLMNNALNYTPAGGTISLRAFVTGGFVQVEVVDTGTGIEAVHLSRIFDRFYRADPSRARSTGGSGLGLAIVKQLVEAQGGHAGVKSEPGKGSTFFFTVPVS